MSNQKSRVCSMALGISLGVVVGLMMMLFAWAGLYWKYGLEFIEKLSHLYIGYNYTLIGGLVGFGWGFLEGFIIGFIIGFIYNLFISGCKSCYIGDPEEQ